jgi:trimeric autotransporter adhesin
VSALAVFDDGTGAALYAAGGFTNAGGQPAERFARWNGSAWTPLPGFPPQSNERVHTLEPYSIGGSARLFAGGSFHRAGDVPVQGFAAWSNGAWSSIGTGNGCDANVLAFQVHDDGTGHGNRLYAAGQFHFAGATNSSGVAAWNGTSWSALGAGIVVDSSLYSVRALATHDEGAGARLFAGGDFYSAGGVSVTNVARWDGSAWSALGNGPNTGVRALASWDDGSGPALYVRGTFTHVGGVPAEGVARWDGSTWSIMSPGIGGPVFSFLLWDDGSGRALYVGAGSGGNARLVKWTGQAWIALPAPPMAFVAALAAYDDGSGAGERLYVAGPFFGIGPTNVARLDGATWTPVGGRVGEIADPVSALMVFDDGTGPALYVAGRFTRAGSAAANNIARLRGGVWHELSSGTDQWVQSLGVFDDGTGPALFAGGFFTTAGSKPSRHIAKLRAPSTTGTSICFGDGLDPMQTAQCPCGNTGLPSHGCANSSFQGAQLCATDSATPHSVQLTASGILPATNALLFAGTGVQTTGAVFGDGVRCVFGFLRRLDTRLPTGSSVTYDVAGDPSGTTTYYQVLYRNFQSFCTPAAFNVTNATRVIW